MEILAKSPLMTCILTSSEASSLAWAYYATYNALLSLIDRVEGKEAHITVLITIEFWGTFLERPEKFSDLKSHS